MGPKKYIYIIYKQHFIIGQFEVVTLPPGEYYIYPLKYEPRLTI